MNELIWLVCPPQMSDVAALAAIATAVSASITPFQLTQAVQQANGRFWTITQAQQPIGFATLLPIPGLPHQFDLAGGIAPKFQRQGAGSFLWQYIKETVAGTAVRQINHMVSDLNSPAAHFLYHHQFTLAHEEWTMELANLQTAVLPTPATRLSQLQIIDRETAVRTLPTLYQRCFAHTPWFQPYTAAEVAATWETNDQLYALVENNSLIGFIWLHFSENNVAEIEPMGIVQEKQGMGYGRFLLITTLNRLHAQSIQSVTLGVWVNNYTAIHLYQTMGFRYTSSRMSLVYTFPPT